MRTRLLAAGLLTVLLASGCGASPITVTRLQHAVAPTFANLYAVQQSLRGRHVDAEALHARATCVKGGAAEPDRGPGGDWACDISWFDQKRAITVIASYSVHVLSNGCYAADGDGPADLNGQQTITAADGTSVTNPLWEFDGCFDLT